MIESAYAEETKKVLDDRAGRPVMEPDAPKSWFWSSVKAPFVGAATGATESAAMGSDILGAFGAVQAGYGVRADPSMLFDTDMQKTVNGEKGHAALERAQSENLFSSDTGNQLRQTAKSMMPDPETSTAVENILFGLGRFGAKAVGYTVATGNPFSGAVLTGVDEGMTEADKLKDQGVDFKTRTSVGVVAGASAAAATALPVVGKTIASTVGLTVAGGPGAFIAQQAASKSILEHADYSKVAEQYDPFDPVGLAVSTLVPAAFATYATRGMRKSTSQASTSKPLQDMTRDERVNLKYNDSSIDDYTVQAAQREGVPPELLLALKNAGERSNPNQVSEKKAAGVAQLMPENQAKYGVTDAADPIQSIDGMAKYVRDTMKQYGGNTQAVIADYNGGPRQAKLVMEGKAPASKETADYLERVNNHLAENQGKAAGRAVADDMDAVDAARTNLNQENIRAKSLARDDDIAGQSEHVRAFEKAADQIASGERVNVEDTISAERIELSKAYDIVKNMPQGDKFDPLVMIRPEDLEPVAVSRGGYKGKGDVEVKGQGFGLTKFIWRHGEESIKPKELQISKDDILAFPEVIRNFEPHIYEDNKGGHYREWRVNLPNSEGKQRVAVFVDKSMGEENGRHVISAYIQDPKNVKSAIPLSERRADHISESPGKWAYTRTEDTHPAFLQQSGQMKSAEISIAENAELKSSLDSQTTDIASLSPDMMVQLDGMDTPVRVADLMDNIKKEAAKEKEDAPLVDVAAKCFLRNN